MQMRSGESNELWTFSKTFNITKCIKTHVSGGVECIMFESEGNCKENVIKWILVDSMKRRKLKCIINTLIFNDISMIVHWKHLRKTIFQNIVWIQMLWYEFDFKIFSFLEMLFVFINLWKALTLWGRELAWWWTRQLQI